MGQAILPRIIGAIGEENFAVVAADATLGFMEFDLAAVLFHKEGSSPELLFDNFGEVGCRQGIENYVRFTHRINPMLRVGPLAGACRARDFHGRKVDGHDHMGAHLVQSADEELGFRTVGWPSRLEEIGLYFEACDGVVELSLYRERASRSVGTGRLRALSALRPTMAAMFERHLRLRSSSGWSGRKWTLTPREQEVCGLLLMGCSSAAIALRLVISQNTVKDHRKQVFRKLAISSLAELFALDRQDRSPPIGGMADR